MCVEVVVYIVCSICVAGKGTATDFSFLYCGHGGISYVVSIYNFLAIRCVDLSLNPSPLMHLLATTTGFTQSHDVRVT